MSKDTEYLGQWYIADQEGNYTMVNVLEVSDGLARAVGKNIPLDELVSLYIRKDLLVGDPWAIQGDIPSELSTLINNDYVQEILPNADDSNARMTIQNQKHVSDNMLQEVSYSSPEHELIRNAIKLTPNTKTLSFDIDYTFQFDIVKIATVAKSLSIDSNIVTEVIMSNIKHNPEQFFVSIEKALNKLLNEPECTNSDN